MRTMYGPPAARLARQLARRAAAIRLPGRQHPRRSPLLDQIMPLYQIASRHSVVVRAPAPAVYHALTATPLRPTPLARVLFGLRLLPDRLLHGRRPPHRTPRTLVASATGSGFVVLTAVPDREVILGVAGRFWRLTGNLARTASAAAWCAYQAPGTAHAALSLRVVPIDYHTSRLSTETRVDTRGRAARIAFRLYWTVIGPFSGLLRRSLLRQAKAAAEQSSGLFRLTP